jgi:hypothetical protein
LRVLAGGSLSGIVEDDSVIKLTRDEALVLSDWLDRMMGAAEFDGLVNQGRAVWSSLYRILGAQIRRAGTWRSRLRSPNRMIT